MKNILLCGGSGTRLWPVSRKNYPKQFCDLGFDKSLFQQTIIRNAPLCDETILVTNTDQQFLAMDQLSDIAVSIDISKYKMIIEPIARNTAPAITIACLLLNPEDIVLVTPSDQIIKNDVEYNRIIERAVELASKGNIVTLGINPSYAETGFGYIQAIDEKVISFKEKPDQTTAENYIESGGYYWNSGIFVFKVNVFLEEMKKYAPNLLQKCELVNLKHEATVSIKHNQMFDMPSISIDYAVMEKSRKLKMIVADLGWSDLGNYDALYNSFEKDDHGNVIRGSVISLGSKMNFIMSSDRLIAAIDVDNIVVVDTKDAIYISKKGSTAKIRDLINQLETTKKDITINPTTVHRPWGTYTILDQGDRYKVKRILIKPLAQISLQKHFHRSEHWTIVKGLAEIQIGEKTVFISQNESIFIPIGETHRLRNTQEIDLVIIETQVGDYLEEDDIVRLDDLYNRI